MNNTKVQIRATNLTREGMEMMFNIRDTNRRRCSGQKDQFWLYLGSGDTATNDECNPNDNVFQKGIYAIKEGKKDDSGDRFIYAEKLTNIDEDVFYDLEGFFTDEDDYNKARSGALVTFTGTYTYLSGGVNGEPVTGNIGDLLGDVAEFYRIVRVYGIYKKTGDMGLITNPADLTNGDPKEMRFCVKTFYKLGAGIHSSELCSIMTNFME